MLITSDKKILEMIKNPDRHVVLGTVLHEHCRYVAVDDLKEKTTNHVEIEQWVMLGGIVNDALC